MHKRALSLLLVAVASLPAVARDANPPDTAALLKSLNELREQNQKSGDQHLGKVYNEILNASRNRPDAIALYERAMQITTFIGKNREQTQFQEWKRKEAEALKSPALQTAVQMHLRYLALSLRAAADVPMEEIIPDLIRYTNDLSQVIEDKSLTESGLGRQPLFNRSVASSVFADTYNLSPQLSKVKGWEMVPGNFDGIYEKTILPYMRKQKDSNLLRYWDNRLQREEAIAKDTSLTFRMERFDQITRPSLIWSRSQDLMVLGFPNQAIGEMYKLIRSYPNHPDNPRWITFLEGVLQPPTPEAAAPTQETATTTPPTQETTETARIPATSQ